MRARHLDHLEARSLGTRSGAPSRASASSILAKPPRTTVSRRSTAARRSVIRGSSGPPPGPTAASASGSGKGVARLLSLIDGTIPLLSLLFRPLETPAPRFWGREVVAWPGRLRDRRDGFDGHLGAGRRHELTLPVMVAVVGRPVPGVAEAGPGVWEVGGT